MPDQIDKTGERLVPHGWRTKEEYIQFLRHKFAYLSIRQWIKPDAEVLEIGSGEGYGTNLLADFCRKVIAIDVDRKAVEHAQRTYANQKCEFRLYRGPGLPFDDDHFDAVVCFQVIEHVKDDLGLAREMHRVLRPGGHAFITTPNRTYRLKPGQKPWNRFHVREYYPAELSAMLKTVFQEVNLLGISGNEMIQTIEYNRVKTGSILRVLAGSRIRRLLPKKLDYLIASSAARLKARSNRSIAAADYEHLFSVDDFRLHDTDIERSLDIMAICCKR